MSLTTEQQKWLAERRQWEPARTGFDYEVMGWLDRNGRCVVVEKDNMAPGRNAGAVLVGCRPVEIK